MAERTFRFDVRTDQTLEKLARYYETDVAGVIRKSIALLDVCREYGEQGAEVYVKEPGGELRRIEF